MKLAKIILAALAAVTVVSTAARADEAYQRRAPAPYAQGQVRVQQADWDHDGYFDRDARYFRHERMEHERRERLRAAERRAEWRRRWREREEHSRWER